ncbi:MAG TPA: HAD-IB family phosphatase, partial [Chitinophagaceae bacterium]|nr:HAD-IB family phosphatase [Chitinophagaceae bacterium]
MVTVIIPALNESDTIESVVNFAKKSPHVSEILVVDDKSLDDTVKRAKAAGAKVITSTKLGKGASMKEGLMFASNEFVLFLDGDINPYPPATIELLSEPLMNNEADFVKACFQRNAGRVTELVAKPLLNILFPDLGHFNQPLSGMIAGKRSLLQQLEFRDDYGVDIGILIDMHLLKARIKEVNIGYLDNKSRPWQALGKMSKEVSQAIIAKAFQQNKPNATLEELQSFSEIRDQMEFAIKESLQGLEKLVIFDQDNTLLQGRFIDNCARFYGFDEALLRIRSLENDPVIITKNIARLMKGLTISQIIAVADSIPLVDDAIEVIAELKKRGYVVGIISDSYDVVVNHTKTRIGADFSLGNELEFSKSIATGEVKLPSFFFNHQDSLCKHSMCKTNAMQHILKQYKIDINNAIAVGDSDNDLCMIRNVGIGVSFCSPNELLNFVADKKIT